MAGTAEPTATDTLSSSSIPRTAAESHPLLDHDDSAASPAATAPGPALVNRPVWAQQRQQQHRLSPPHALSPTFAGPARNFDLKGLSQRIEAEQLAGPSSRKQTTTGTYASEDPASSRSQTHTDDDDDDYDDNGDEDQDAGNTTIIEHNEDIDSEDDIDGPAAELAAVLSRGMRSPRAAKSSQAPPLVSPQLRTPAALRTRSRSASNTPVPRPPRASSRASQRQGAMSPLGRPVLDSRHMVRPDSAFRLADSQLRTPRDDVLDGNSDEEVTQAPSLDLMISLHTMSAREVERCLESAATEGQGALSTVRSRDPTIASPPHTKETSRRSARTQPSTPRVVDAPLAPGLPENVLSMVQSLSRALSEALDEAAKAKASAIKERAKHLEAMEHMNAQHQSRESALTSLCLQHGIKEGEISRALVRAPVLDAEASKRKNHSDAAAARKAAKRQTVIGVTGIGSLAVAPATATGALAGALEIHGPTLSGWNRHREPEPVGLPQSLQEAMLEDLDGVSGSSFKESSPSIKSASIKSSRRERSPSVASVRTEASSQAPPKLAKAAYPDAASDSASIASSSRSPAVPQSPTKPLRPKAVRSVSSNSAGARSGSSGLSEWASGLMPWAGSSANRKAAASTASSNVKATSPGRHSVTGENACDDEERADPFNAPAQQSGSAFSALSESEGDATIRGSKQKTGTPTRHGRSFSTASLMQEPASPGPASKSSRSGLGILGTLAWRRKKPTPVANSNDHSGDAEDDEVFASGTVKAGPKAKSVGDGEDASSSIESSELPNEDMTREVADRPVAIRRASSKSVPVAIHEAIGPEPTSPSTERLRSELGLPAGALPKPTHFKAIFLATRVMTSEPSSLLYDSGKKTSELVAKLAMSLVGRARDEGKIVEEPIRPGAGGRKSSGSRPRPISLAQAKLSQVEELAKRVPSHGSTASSAATISAASSKASAATSKAASATTFARAFGRYTRPPSKGSTVEPNVTRLPDMYQFSNTNLPANAAAATSSVVTEPGVSPRPPATVELEAIIPSDAAPPTMMKRRRKALKAASSWSSAAASSSGSRSIDRSHASKAGGNGKRLDPLDEESSGDEFEVYGGKGPVPGYGHVESLTSKEDDDEDENDDDDEAELLTDRYGFIYDATRADIRLLRQARKASTPAPACLTGIRVGVRARGGTDSQSEEDKEDPDLNESDTEEEEMTEGESGFATDADARVVSNAASERSSLAAASLSEPPEDPMADGRGRSGSISTAKRKGLLSVAPSKPVAEALSVSVTSQASLSTNVSSKRGAATETSSVGAAERSSRSGRDDDQGKAGTSFARTPSTSSSRRLAKPPSTSSTIRRLLSQLQDMHDSQQSTQKAKWDDFLERRRERLRAAHAEALVNGTGADGAAGRSGAAGIFAVDKVLEEEYSQGLVGINRMGDSKAGKEDWKEFLELCQAGIPLCYRAKIWAECSGANEVHEPGRYQELLDEHEGETNECLTQIDLDVHRTMPTNMFFGGDGPGVAKLRRLLVAFSWYNPACGYCQGMNNLAATLLLTHATEEEAFWVLVCIIEKILPSEYYTSHLLVSQADQRVLIELVDELMPALSAHLSELGVDLPAVTFAWFLSLYTDCLPVETLFRVWDVMFVEGMVILFRVAIAILRMNEAELLATRSAAAFYGQVHSMTSRLFSVDRLVKVSCPCPMACCAVVSTDDATRPACVRGSQASDSVRRHSREARAPCGR